MNRMGAVSSSPLLSATVAEYIYKCRKLPTVLPCLQQGFFFMQVKAVFCCNNNNKYMVTM